MSELQKYFKKRLKECGLTEKTNFRTISYEGRPQKVPIFYPVEDKDALGITYVQPDGECEYYLDGKKQREFERLRYRNPKKYTDKSDFNFTGIRRHIFNPAKRNGTLDRLEYFKKGVLVFDDCRVYLSSATDDRIRRLIIRRRQRMVDVFAVGHGFNEVPPVFFTFATDIVLFRTTDNIARRRNCLKDFDRMAEAQARVNKKAVQNPHYFEIIKFA